MARVLAVIILAGVVIGYVPNDDIRYALCPGVKMPAAELGEFGVIRGYAASVTMEDGRLHDSRGRARSPLTLRVAVLYDDGNSWSTELPSMDRRNPNDGHAQGISYAKCYGSMLPNPSRITSQVWINSSDSKPRRRPLSLDVEMVKERGWSHPTECRFVRHFNVEVKQQTLHCPVGSGLVRRWKRAGPPPILFIEVTLGFDHEASDSEVAPKFPLGSLRIQLCRVQRPLVRLSFCSQPLYGLRSVTEEVQFSIDDWLRYHLDILGIGHAEIYDNDGSFADVAAQHWRERSPRWHERLSMHPFGTVSYNRLFPANLSSTLADLSRDHPYCSEMFAYSHCIVTHRAFSRWVLILHAPDEYVVSSALVKGGKAALDWVLDKVEATLPEGEPVGMAMVEAASFAQGGDFAGAVQKSQPGHVIAASQLRSNIFYQHSPMIDPTQCGCAGAHTCYASENAQYRALMVWVQNSWLRVHHYVEMLGRNHGRCSSQHKTCNVGDPSALWLVPHLQEAAAKRNDWAFAGE